ncbi:MAG: alpha-L-fucosidase [Oscillospiraceae bacterium]|nr:alpha-L-fucosidase [Oscillospiraceae bacterium]
MTARDYLRLVEEVVAQGPYTDTWESLCAYPEPEWYRQARFGVFIHWGVYAVPAFANEWYARNMYIQGSPEYEHHRKTYGNHKTFGYKDFIPLFRGERFDAGEWMALIRDSGAQYVMPVAEHHDGFQMYDSALSEFNAARMGPRRDVLGELKRAAESAGLVFALSQHRAEHCWFFNGGLAFDSDVADPAHAPFYGTQLPIGGADSHDIYAAPPPRAHCEDWLARLAELVERYRPAVVYLDWWVHNLGFKPYLKKFAAYYYNRAAQWGFEAAVNYKHHAFAPGAAVPDVERGRLDGVSPRIWQSCTATARHSWCHTRQNEYKDPAEPICDLIDAVSKNGRLLLNIGPRADGVIPDEDREILQAMGRWLRQNGEGLYGASCWETFGEGPSAEGCGGSGGETEYTPADIRFTCKGGAVYAFVMRWPAGGAVTIRSLKKARVLPHAGGDLPIRAVSVLGTDAPVSFTRDETGLHIRAEGIAPARCPVTVKIAVE